MKYKEKFILLERENKRLETELKKLEIEKEKRLKEQIKRLKCIVYCDNCQTVYGALVPKGVSIRESVCGICGVINKGHLVTKINPSAKK